MHSTGTLGRGLKMTYCSGDPLLNFVFPAPSAMKDGVGKGTIHRLHFVNWQKGRYRFSCFRLRLKYPLTVVFNAILCVVANYANVSCGAEDRGGRNDHGPERQEPSPSTLSERVSVVLTKLGAVPVTPRNTLKLLRAGESVLLYPGGAKEALHQKVIHRWSGLQASREGEFIRKSLTRYYRKSH